MAEIEIKQSDQSWQRLLVRLATDPIFTSDNPRSEDPAQILRDMEAGVIGQELSGD